MSVGWRVSLAIAIEFPFIGLVMFLAAGTIAWAAGWVFLILMAVCSIGFVVWLLRSCPGLLEERLSMFRPDQPAWDKVFVVVLLTSFVAWLILMPLDAVRFRWSCVPLWLQAAGVVVLLVSFYLFFLVYRENQFLSPMVRVQEERRQRVISTGPYRYVRHPMYAASLLFFLGTALLLGSWYGALATIYFAVLLAIRAIGEERLLREELEGYDEYVSRVRYRIVPGVW